MAERNVTVKACAIGAPPPDWSIGRAFAHQSSIWRVQGVYLAPTPSGERELWWILSEQKDGEAEFDGGTRA